MAAAVVTKDTLIGDLLRIDANVAPILLGIGMHCLGCPSSQGETIEEAGIEQAKEHRFKHLIQEISLYFFRGIIE